MYESMEYIVDVLDTGGTPFYTTCRLNTNFCEEFADVLNNRGTPFLSTEGLDGRFCCEFGRVLNQGRHLFLYAGWLEYTLLR